MPSMIEPRTTKTISRGRYDTLGAVPTGDGVNFALFSRDAREVHLLLFDDSAAEPTDVIRVENRTKFIWHIFVKGLKPGQLYGYRVFGEHDPARGLRFNPNKLLIDPYAKALTGKASNEENLLLAYETGSPAADLSFDARDNSRVVPKGIVIEDAFDWRGDRPPEIPFDQLVIYEVHLKGFTAHPSSKASRPGTYLGFIEKIPHLKRLGVNAVELLPLHEFHIEDFLLSRGLTNYWGYNTLGFFAPESSYGTKSAPGSQVSEFKTLVRELHRAGIEVILDVVYNHTAEGNELGPTLSLRGIDNRTYYCLTGRDGEPGRHYMNWTGCGNSLNLADPNTLRLVMDSLRYWTQVMHVDGFRFDLASVLGREEGGFRASGSFFDAVSQDPALRKVKLVAEPWDLGTYQVGNFPVDWSEWNGRFRDTIRRFMKADTAQVRDLGFRLTGSADLYGEDGRSAWNSVNFVTCHDGFTLRDLVTYHRKHNDANQEGNRDGTDDNNSWNCGAEGETDDPEVIRLRLQLAKNYVCALLFSSGTPMILGGDEFLRTQSGNNNAYCQDNEISWMDWSFADRHAGMLEFTRKAIALTRRCTILQRRKFFFGADLDADNVPDIHWFGADGGAVAWNDSELRTLCWQLDGGEEASELGDYRLFFVFNADWHRQFVRLPALSEGHRWRRLIDTSLPDGEDFMEPGSEIPLEPPDHYLANARSTVVLLGR